jgi:hypothetical protein
MKTRFAALAVAALLLTGCTPTTTATTDRPAGDSAGGEGVPPCFVGQWDLNVAQFQDDAEFFLLDSQVPIESLALSGSQVLSISADGLVTLGTRLTSTTTLTSLVGGQSLVTTTTSLGDGAWTSSGPTVLSISDFSFSESTVTNDDPTIPHVAGCDFTGVPVVDVQCDEDTLFLIGPDAPYGAYFTRH